MQLEIWTEVGDGERPREPAGLLTKQSEWDWDEPGSGTPSVMGVTRRVWAGKSAYFTQLF